jgi:hypothetical protein
LTTLLAAGRAGSTIAAYSSAITETIRLASNGEAQWGALPILSRFRVGASVARPPREKPSGYWSVDLFLEFLVKMGPDALLPPNRRRDRLIALLRIHWMCRSSDLSRDKFFREEVHLDTDSGQVRFYLPKERKTSAVSRKGYYSDWLLLEDNLRFPSFSIAKLLRSYLDDTASLVSGEQAPVFVGHHRGRVGLPGLSADRIASAFKALLAESGVDVSIFTAHSARGASSSFCADSAPALQELIMETARWGSAGQSLPRRSRTFQSHYHRETPGVESSAASSITEALWEGFVWKPHALVTTEEYLAPTDYWMTREEHPRVLGFRPPTSRTSGIWQVERAETSPPIWMDHERFIWLLGLARVEREEGP